MGIVVHTLRKFLFESNSPDVSINCRKLEHLVKKLHKHRGKEQTPQLTLVRIKPMTALRGRL